MRKTNTFYITTPIFYPNARPHLGHAYSTLICDALTRYHALGGEDTYFLTGTDENTEKVIEAARKIGEEPRVYLDKIVHTFKVLYANLGIRYTQFIRTSDETTHWPGAIEMWKRLEQRGDIYKGEYHGLYCVGCESFITEKELVDGKCSVHGTEPKQLSEENYFFRLSAYTDRIKQIVQDGSLAITPALRKQELLALLEQGLEDISFSRPSGAVTWGIPVPGDSSQKMYVWMDALTNYVSALGFGRGEENMHFWPGVHVVGKDILRFHAAIWPAMLLSADLSLPRGILVHGMIISGGKKMSKSLGNVIDPNGMVSRYGTEAARYLLLRHVHPFEDTDVTAERMDEWYNAHLANGLGNLVSRVMKMAETHLANPIERPAEGNFPSEYTDALDQYELQKAADFIWRKIGELDERIAVAQPFKVIKEDPEEGEMMIRELVIELYLVARMLTPFMPETSRIIKETILANKKPQTLFERIEPLS